MGGYLLGSLAVLILCLFLSFFSALSYYFIKRFSIKNNIFDIEKIYQLIGKFSKMRFIIFIDDLSFEKIDSDYKIIKSTLDGSIQNQPTNIVLYITSNRRHLMSRDMIDNERSSAIHTDESVEEKFTSFDNIEKSKEEEDDLEIPAFLRRQKN